MYPNVRSEMKKRKLTLKWLAELWNVRIATASQKLSGKYPISVREAKLLRNALGDGVTIDYLFSEGE